MKVPPFVPQPIEIPNNVAEQAYRVRLAFIRRVVALYFVSLAVIAGATAIPLPIQKTNFAPAAIFALLILSATRALTKGRSSEQRISLALSPLLFVSLGVLVRQISVAWPVWALGIGPLCAVGYVFCCGMDLSFLGLWFLSLLASTLGIFGVGRWQGYSGIELTEAAIVNAAYVSYWVYDLAALLTRRRLGEEVGAVLDLYRDALNMFSYPIRVWEHWKRHRIWSLKT